MNQIDIASEEYKPVIQSSTPDLDSSFNSLPPGETYHLPPEDEDDPFDTSNVNVQNSTLSSNILSRYTNYATENTLNTEQQYNLNNSGNSVTISPLQDPKDGTAGPPSIISQLLASQPSSTRNSPQPAETPPPSRRETCSKDNDTREMLKVPSPARHRRAVSTMSEAETFLIELVSILLKPSGMMLN